MQLLTSPSLNVEVSMMCEAREQYFWDDDDMMVRWLNLGMLDLPPSYHKVIISSSINRRIETRFCLLVAYQSSLPPHK